MSVRKLSQGTINLLYDQISSAMPAALDAVVADSFMETVPKMSLENIKKIYVHPTGKALLVPAIFLLIEDFDFRIREMQANCVNAVAKVTASLVLEDQDERTLMYKSWRYESALHSVLDHVTMVSSDNKLKCVSVVYNVSPQPVVLLDKSGGFRKETVFKLNVDHIEQY